MSRHHRQPHIAAPDPVLIDDSVPDAVQDSPAAPRRDVEPMRLNYSFLLRNVADMALMSIEDPWPAAEDNRQMRQRRSIERIQHFAEVYAEFLDLPAEMPAAEDMPGPADLRLAAPDHPLSDAMLVTLSLAEKPCEMHGDPGARLFIDIACYTWKTQGAEICAWFSEVLNRAEAVNRAERESSPSP